MVRQYRHGIGKVTLELPGGLVDQGFTPLEAARKELLEETGYQAKEMALLGMGHPQPIMSLQKMVEEERERVTLWWGMSNSVLDISTNLDSTNLPKKLVRYARELMAADKAVLAIVTEKTNKVLLYESDEENKIRIKLLSTSDEPVNTLLRTGKPIIAGDSELQPFYPTQEVNAKSYLGVPLYSKNHLSGVMAVINNKSGESFTQKDQEFLMILGAQAAVALDNARLYERTNDGFATQKVYQTGILKNHLPDHTLGTSPSL